jgi:predicted ATP-dependent serine protease
MLTSPLFKTGISLIDDHLILDPGQFILLAGSSAVGKTDLVLSLAAQAHLHASVLVNCAETATANKLRTTPVAVISTNDLGVLEKVMADTRPDLVFVEALERFHQPANWKGTSAQYRTSVGKKLAEMSRDHKTVIILTADFDRAEKPTSFKDAGGVEENADTVLVLRKDDSGRLILRIAKNRGGPSAVSNGLIRDEKTGGLRSAPELVPLAP